MVDADHDPPAARPLKTLVFYPLRADGSAVSLSVADIDSDAAQALFARQVFDTHDSAVAVEVYDDGVLLRRYSRADVGARQDPRWR